MKILKENSNFPGIYVIKNSINGKIYVGKSKNCYKRLHQHLTDIKIDNRNYNENSHLLNAVKNMEKIILNIIYLKNSISITLIQNNYYPKKNYVG